jgi:GH15 family glucan-1,4-alpha-glucosidase
MDFDMLNRDIDDNSKNDKRHFLQDAILGAILGIFTTLAYQYFRRILRQPRLVPKVILSEAQDLVTQETRALFIARENLLSGVEERRLENREHKLILHAGYRNFCESWARDFGFAAYGLLALEEYQTVKDTLEAFFWHQTSQGQLPVKLQSLNVVTRFMHSLLRREQPLDGSLKPKYITGHRTPSLDGQALLVIAACNYIQKTGDHDFAHEYWQALQRSLQWLKTHARPSDKRLHQRAYADWADSVSRQGAILYTNVVYWKAMQEMAALAAILGREHRSESYRQTSEQLKKSIRRNYWRTDLGYFTTSDEMPNLCSAGNLLAIAWGLVDEDQANAILNAIQSARMAEPVPTQAAYPAYLKTNIAIENKLAGLTDYHSNSAWLWIGAWHGIALAHLGRLEETESLMSRISEIIVKDGQVHEVYGQDDGPLSSFWYTSESPLTWSAGMVVYAFHYMETILQERYLRNSEG